MKLVVAVMILFLDCICVKAANIVWRPEGNQRETHSQCVEKDPNASQAAEKEFIAFEKFVKDFRKEYGSYAEFQKRYMIFRRNLKIMLEHGNNGVIPLKINEFSDKSESELRCMLSIGLRSQSVPMNQAIDKPNDFVRGNYMKSVEKARGTQKKVYRYL